MNEYSRFRILFISREAGNYFCKRKVFDTANLCVEISLYEHLIFTQWKHIQLFHFVCIYFTLSVHYV